MVMFDTPDEHDPENRIQCLAQNFPFSHVWLLVYRKYDDSYFYAELTEEGLHILKVTPCHLFWVAGEVKLMVSYQVTDQELQKIVRKMNKVEGLPIHWSNWYVPAYLQNGFFPSFTCASLVSWILFDKKIGKPKDLLRFLVEAEYHHDITV